MMMRNVFTKTIYDMRWSLLAFSAGLALLAFFVLLLYPSFAETFDSLFEGVGGPLAQALLGSLDLAGTVEGYLNMQFFPFIPILLAVFLIIVTSAAIAGEEEDKTLGLQLARPVPRWKVLTEKAASIFVGLLTIVVATALGAVIGALIAGVDVPLGDLALSMIAAVPFGVWLLGFGLFCSAIFKSRLTAALVVTGVFVVAYMLNSLSEFVTSLVFYNRFAPVYYFSWGQPLVMPFDWSNAIILTTAGLIFFALALYAFEKREVTG